MTERTAPEAPGRPGARAWLVLAVIPMLATLFLWQRFGQPYMAVGVGIRWLALGIALWAYSRYREARVLPLAVMFFLMGLRMVLSILIRSGMLERSRLTEILSEVPGHVVTLLAFLTIAYIVRILAGHARSERALSQRIGRIEGFVPICSYCKRIRRKDADPLEERSWQRVEEYLETDAEREVSHSVCPVCAEKHSPGIIAGLRAERDAGRNG
jgi:hypothetical protein